MKDPFFHCLFPSIATLVSLAVFEFMDTRFCIFSLLKMHAGDIGLVKPGSRVIAISENAISISAWVFLHLYMASRRSGFDVALQVKEFITIIARLRHKRGRLEGRQLDRGVVASAWGMLESHSYAWSSKVSDRGERTWGAFLNVISFAWDGSEVTHKSTPSRERSSVRFLKSRPSWG